MDKEAEGPETVGKSSQSSEHANAVGIAGHSFQNKLPYYSSSIAGPRHSPVTPLAPLEFLQNQRKGSITDPSLHAGPVLPSPFSSSATLSNTLPALRHTEPGLGSPGSSTSQDTLTRMAMVHPRPASPYRFGDASVRKSDAHGDRGKDYVKRSSSVEPPGGYTADGAAARSSESGYMREGKDHTQDPETGKNKDTDKMEIDMSRSQKPGSIRRAEEVDYNTRRPSLAGTKRKKSSDNNVFAGTQEEIDSQLAGPGVSSGMNVDTTEGPAPKRRGSAIDTQRVAQLSLYDRRRNSEDGRTSVLGPWFDSRRDSTVSTSSSAFTTTTTGTPGTGYSTPNSAVAGVAGAGDSPRGRPGGDMATFAWPANPHPDQVAGQASTMNEANNIPLNNNTTTATMHPPTLGVPYEPLAIMPPITFAQDRRMPAPNVSTDAMQPPASGPARVLRSRSRPPSRARLSDQSLLSAVDQASGSSTKTEDAATPSQSSPQTKEGSTPYSRSPELRVSHKLAERKRRKEMKDLFDELRDQLPADRGMKASKWEILSKAVDFIATLKQNHQDMSREIEMLRHELDSMRQGLPPHFVPPHPVVYGHAPSAPVHPYIPPSGPAGPGPQPPQPLPPPPQPPQQQPHSRPSSSQNAYPPHNASPVPPHNGNGLGVEAPHTETPS